jgi:hypothetical protein
MNFISFEGVSETMLVWQYVGVHLNGVDLCQQYSSWCRNEGSSPRAEDGSTPKEAQRSLS